MLSARSATWTARGGSEIGLGTTAIRRATTRTAPGPPGTSICVAIFLTGGHLCLEGGVVGVAARAVGDPRVGLAAIAALAAASDPARYPSVRARLKVTPQSTQSPQRRY